VNTLHLIRRHPLSTYFGLTFALSWGGFVLVGGPDLLVSTNWQAEGKFLSAVMVMLAGPSIAGLLMTGLVDGREGYRDLFLFAGMPSRSCPRPSSRPASCSRYRSHHRSSPPPTGWPSCSVVSGQA
jgi:hypothetical protein